MLGDRGTVRMELEDLKRTVDVTLPGRGARAGSLHPLTLARREIEGIFAGLGYEVRTGPWVETEWHNFDAERA